MYQIKGGGGHTHQVQRWGRAAMAMLEDHLHPAEGLLQLIQHWVVEGSEMDITV